MANQRTAMLLGAAMSAATLLGTYGLARADSALDAAAQNPGNWAMYGRTYSNDRYSPLTDINDQNVGQMKLAWAFQVGTVQGEEASPIVIDGTMYLSSANGPAHVYAIDATTGKMKWQYDTQIAEDVAPEACCGLVSRGVAYADGKILFGTLDDNLIALDANTGKELWKTKVTDYKDGSVITSPPLVVKNLAIIGYGGGEYGVRGSLQAYDIATGKQVWRTWTVPSPDQPGGDTWKGDSYIHGGGTAWNVGAYDPKTNTVFWGTSNPGPWDAAVRSTGTSDYGKLTNLGTASTLAIDPDTGKIKWQLQSTPADAWDYDGIVAPVLATINIHGADTPVYLKDDRNGFFFVADRDNGKLLSATAFAPINWASGFDVSTGRPIENVSKRPRLDFKATDICPAAMGATNWQPMSYNPQTGLAYIPTSNMCMDMKAQSVEYHRGMFFLGNDFSMHEGHGGWLGKLVAWDPVAAKPAWSVQQPLPWNGGTMTTAGNLVFQGDIEGVFHAYDAKTGQQLWHMRLGSGMGAGPVTYSVNGKQYVAILTGRPSTMPAFMGQAGKDILAASAAGGTLFVFSE